MTAEEFLNRLEQLRERLVSQGERIGEMITRTLACSPVIL
jgi:hypothetical protein